MLAPVPRMITTGVYFLGGWIDHFVEGKKLAVECPVRRRTRYGWSPPDLSERGLIWIN